MNEAGASGMLELDAESLYADLRHGARQLMDSNTKLAGITSGGVWLAERLAKDLGLADRPSSLSSALHRDDFAQRGLTSSAQTTLEFDVNGADILVLDDVLHTGRTIRAVLNELFDYGRPARVRLAVLVDRRGRQLPIEASFAAARLALPDNQQLALARRADGKLHFAIETI